METVIPHSRLVFLGGVHGVGKSTICEDHLRPAGYACFTASALIREGGSVDVNISKQVSDVDHNQWILLEGLKKVRRSATDVVLDGHYCLLNSERKIEKVPMWLFKEMRADGLALAIGDPAVIAQRLSVRDGHPWTAEFVSNFQTEEVKYAREVADALGVPLHEFSAGGQAQEFCASYREIFGSKQIGGKA